MLSYKVCKAQASAEDIIVRKVLEQLDGSQNIRLHAKPYNTEIKRFMKGSPLDSIEFRDVPFQFHTKAASKWSKSKVGKCLSDKLLIIEDTEKVPTVLPWETDKIHLYISLSNPVFSVDGQYALIYINYSHNIPEPPAEGYIYVFKKQDTEWVQIAKILTTIS